MEKIKNLEICGAIMSLGLGVFLHFSYELSGYLSVVALFSAVNESVWEHTKLAIFPIIFFLPFEYYFFRDKKRLLWAKVAESVFVIIFIITFYYTYTGALGFESVIIDILTFVIAVITGKYISYRILSNRHKVRAQWFASAIFMILLLAFYFTMTFKPCEIPLFMDETTGFYGIDNGEV